MELDLEGTNANVPIIDDDSESSYEQSSRDEESEDQSQDEKSRPLSRADSSGSEKVNSKRKSKNNRSNKFDNGASTRPDENALQKLKRDLDFEKRIREDAKKWAATFEAPQSPGRIRSPTREEAGSRKRKQGDQPPGLPSKTRAKRFKSFYSNEYRELLNSETRDTSRLGSAEGQSALSNSQIGSVLWTAKEKDVFFSALERLGRDNVAGIALHIGSKTELEVQEYIHVLQGALRQRSAEDNRKQTLHIVDYPAALEISEECCGVLERAADALSTRQDCYEIEKEEAKWYGDSWLLTQNLSKTIHKQRRDPDEEAEIEATLPAANLFDLKNWLELSREIFMNRGGAYEDDNWENLAEPGELPSIRTTAFDDFHSLAVSITKRLISTTLYCTMSRQKARQSKLLKRADVTQDDVKAAINMLGLPTNSSGFWTRCARRCHLNVVDDENSDSGDGTLLTYEEVELAMAGHGTLQSHFHPLSEVEQHQNSTIASEDRVGLEDPIDSPSETEYSSSDDSWHSVDFNQSDEEDGKLGSFAREKSRARKREKKKNMLHAQEEYTEALDTRESQLEEARLWSMLQQTAPFEWQAMELPDHPDFTKNDADGVSFWRDNTMYWSTWEMMPTPVPKQSFIANRAMKSKRGKRKERLTVENGNEEQSSKAADDIEASKTVEVVEAVEAVEAIAEESDRVFESGEEEVLAGDETDDYERLENELLPVDGQDYDSEDHQDSVQEQISVENRSPSPVPARSESP